VGIKEHFATDKGQHQRQADFQITEILKSTRQHKIKRAQPQNRKHVGGEDNKRPGGYGENGGNGVQREDEIGGFHHHQHQGQRREGQAPLPGAEKLLPIQVWRNRVKLAHPFDDAVLFRVNPGLDKKHFEAGKQDEGSQHVEHPMQPGNQRHAGSDHKPTHDQSPNNAPKQHAMLILARDLKIGEEHGNHKDIIHRERQLDEITGQKFQGFLFAAEGFQRQGEEHGQAKPSGGPKQRLPEFDHMRPAMKQPQVEGQKNQYAADKTRPVPSSNVYQADHKLIPAPSPRKPVIKARITSKRLPLRSA